MLVHIAIYTMKQEEIKKALYLQCKQWIANRRLKVEKVIAGIVESLENETKSSAGDKHETGRAMLQIDREQAGQQLLEISKIETSFAKVTTTIQKDTVRLGSVVHTSTLQFFIAVSAGELKVDGQCFYAIGLSAPIGKLLLGKGVGDVVRFRESEITIKTIY